MDDWFILWRLDPAFARGMLQLDSIRFAYSQAPVLNHVSVDAAPGAVTCIVGPSGCGKTTLLQLAAGLLTVQQGEIRINGRHVAGPDLHVPPEQRSVGLVFQEGALFPHLTAIENIRFGLPKAAVERAATLVKLTELGGLEHRYPHELSGGQRQRVALARALAPEPDVLLFDEPYANLDQALRSQLRRATRRLVAELGTVAVFVTHDSDDITELADTVIALHDGVVVQTGTPRQLFDHPEHAAVARLFGQTQTVSARRVGDVIDTPFGHWPVSCLAVDPTTDGALTLLVRPDGLTAEAAEGGQVVKQLRVAGADDLANVAGRGGAELLVRVTRPHELEPGKAVNVTPLPRRVFPLAVDSS
ncbi:MAG: ABC transporter ATP-binding protein [Pseudomonadota bacterium]